MTQTSHRTAARRSQVFISSLLATTILACGCAAWAAIDAAAPPLSMPPVVNQAGFADLVAKVKPAIVNIAVTEKGQGITAQELQSLPPSGTPFSDMLRDYLQQQRAVPVHGLASGFVIDPAGFIVTNNHVIDGASQITVTTNDGQSYPAKVVGRDAKTDLALLKVDASKPLPYVAFGDSAKERVGDWVVAVGNPFGLGGTVTAGIVSAHDRNLDEGPYDDYLQIDAPINPGNSGGPVFNQSGQVIGIDTAIYTPSGGSVGIGFAIPSNVASQVVGQLREHGRVERGWLGVQMQALTPSLAKAVGRPDTKGVIIDAIETNSPAARAQLQQGDIITAFDGSPVTSPEELALAVANAKDGAPAKLTVWRDAREQTVDVVVGRQQVAEAAPARGESSNTAPLGMTLTRLTPELRDRLGLGADAKGVLVAKVAPGGLADESGVRSGDVILRAGNETVTTPSAASTALDAAEREKKAAIPLLVMRNGTTYYIALQLMTG
jgi:serine protease Do